MLIALLLVVLIVAPSIFLFTNIFYSTYESMAKNQLDRGISAGRMFLDSIMSTTDNLALNRQLIETLDGTRSGSLTPLLDSTCTYSLDIAAITVYGENGAVYTSSGVTNPPGAAELASLADIAEFFADEDADEYVSLRTSAIIKAYDNAPYDARAGIISYCRKVYAEDGSVLGCIFADIFPHELFERFNMTDGGADGSVILIAFGGGHFSSEGGDAAQEYLRAEADTSVGGRLVIASTRNFYGGTIRAAVPLAPFYQNTLLIAAIILLCGGALLYAAHWIARIAADWVTNRLNGLLQQMIESSRKINSL